MTPKEFKTKLLKGETLPKGLVVDGWLDLNDCISLTPLPSGLVVKGSLWLASCINLTHLPEGLVVEVDLGLAGCTSLTHLPSGLKVGYWLVLEGCTSLTHLPFDLVVEGSLHIDKHLIDRIPREDLPCYIGLLDKSNQADYFLQRLTNHDS